MFEFNINNIVYVKLKKEGYEHLAKMHRKLFGGNIEDPFPEMRTAEYYKKRADKEGWSQFQMHVFMSKFGEVMHVGTTNMFSAVMRFDNEDMENV